MAQKIYQVHITLVDSQPKIWRRILIDSETLLSDLHKILQTTMGWTNSHLHQFVHGDQMYTPPPTKGELWENYGEIYYEKEKLSDFLKQSGEKINYEYDFGDGWDHTLLLEAILAPDEGEFYPQCIGGRRRCPPEDCGGMGGYEGFLKIIAHPRHPEYRGYMNWLPEGFDPEHFDPREVSTALKLGDFGLLKPEDFY